MKKFSRGATKTLKHYVYALVDPAENKIFYVGKGTGTARPFTHLKKGIDHNNKKLSKRITAIRSEGKEPYVDIIRYGLEREVAHDVESAVIDAIGLENLTNLKKGHGAENSRISALNLNRELGGRRLNVEDISISAILIYSHQSQQLNEDLYDGTRGNWPLSKKRIKEEQNGKLKYRYVFAMRNSVILEIYEILEWYPAGTTVSSREFTKDKKTRYEFIGKIANQPALRRYKNRTLYRENKLLSATQIGFRYLN